MVPARGRERRPRRTPTSPSAVATRWCRRYEMASAYATFAANGIYRKPHLVQQILYPRRRHLLAAGLGGRPTGKHGVRRRQRGHATRRSPATSPSRSCRSSSYSKLECAEKRAVRRQDGHAPVRCHRGQRQGVDGGLHPADLGRGVDGRRGGAGKQVPLKNAERRHHLPVPGLPGKIWQTFMNSYLKDKPKETFGKFEPIGKEVPAKTTTTTTTSSGNNRSSRQPVVDDDNNDDARRRQPTRPTTDRPTRRTRTTPRAARPHPDDRNTTAATGPRQTTMTVDQ